MKKHVNVGTIGHIDHGFNKISRGMRLNAGDYIDPAPWTPEDRKQFKKDNNKLDNIKIDRDGIVSLDLSKSSVRKKVAEQAKRFSVIKTSEKVEK
jgi:hypothetical protein